MKIRTFGVVVCLLVAASALAKNANLAPFEGSWRCTGIAFASPMGPEHPTTATVNAIWTLGGKWMQVRYAEVTTVKNPKPVSAMILMGYNDATKQVVAGSVDNMGGYGTQASSGWEGDKLVLEGSTTNGDQSMKARDTFTKGPRWIKHTGEMEGPNGWMKLDEETCKK